MSSERGCPVTRKDIFVLKGFWEGSRRSVDDHCVAQFGLELLVEMDTATIAPRQIGSFVID